MIYYIYKEVIYIPTSRLKLDFSLESQIDRTNFVESYLSSISFTPSQSELETISTYILWGKNPSGLNLQSEGLAHLKDWAPTQIDSLEALAELPGFQESSLKPLSSPQTRLPKISFDRQSIQLTAPPHILQIYESLWRQIDSTELVLTYYDLLHARRTKPPRESLLSSFTPSELLSFQDTAASLTQFKYIKLKHFLVELRSEQYIYYDFHSERIMPHSQEIYVPQEDILIGTDIQVFPFGLKDNSSLSMKVFKKDLDPLKFSQEELSQISQKLWDKSNSSLYIDFTKDSHVLEIYKLRAELMEAQERDPSHIDTDAAYIISTLQFYEDWADLSPMQLLILDKKLHKSSNMVISQEINKLYNKSYNDNYISTIFHQKIIPSIANAAREHRTLLENIFYPENFKKCKDCGRLLLLNTTNFMKQKKSSDGFSPRCKVCEKIKRSKYIYDIN